MSNPLFDVRTDSGHFVRIAGDETDVGTPAATVTVATAVAQSTADSMPPMWAAGQGKSAAAIEAFCARVVAEAQP